MFSVLIEYAKCVGFAEHSLRNNREYKYYRMNWTNGAINNNKGQPVPPKKNPFSNAECTLRSFRNLWSFRIADPFAIHRNVHHVATQSLADTTTRGPRPQRASFPGSRFLLKINARAVASLCQCFVRKQDKYEKTGRVIPVSYVCTVRLQESCLVWVYFCFYISNFL